jgi:branched-subunit amino acid ABC-type transport system permease component
VLQILFNTLIFGSEIAIIAVGVALSYSILRFANFAHVQFAVVGAYLTFTLSQYAALPIPLAAVIAAVLTGGLAMLIDWLVFARLRNITPEGKMIVSWGVALFIRSIIAAVFGGSARVFPIDSPTWSVAGAFLTRQDVIVVAATAVAMLALHALLFRTRAGTALRALASNRDLAATRGIPAARMIGLMWFICGVTAALGGTLFALETQLQPNMDLMMLLPVFSAVTIGGLDRVFGAAAGAMALSLAQNLLISVDFGALISGQSWSVPSQFRDFIAVGAMVLILLLRPRRLSARREG